MLIVCYFREEMTEYLKVYLFGFSIFSLSVLYLYVNEIGMLLIL
jgi:hypothetical protein